MKWLSKMSFSFWIDVTNTISCIIAIIMNDENYDLMNQTPSQNLKIVSWTIENYALMN